MRTRHLLLTNLLTFSLTLLLAELYLIKTQDFSFFPVNTAETTAYVRPTPTPIYVAPDSMKIFNDVNEYRQQNNIPALSLNKDLCHFGAIRANDLHYGRTPFDHSGFYPMVTTFKPMPFDVLSENLAKGPDPDYLVTNGWKGSPAHNELLMDSSYTHGCVATEGIYKVLVVGK